MVHLQYLLHLTYIVYKEICDLQHAYRSLNSTLILYPNFVPGLNFVFIILYVCLIIT